MKHGSWRLYAFLAITVSLCAFPAAAGEVLFGPVTFAASSGKPQPVTVTFPAGTSAGCGSGTTRYVMTVSNPGGRVSSAILELNGRALLRERDFPLGTDRTLVFDPLPTNTLTVTIKGGTRDAALAVTVEKRVTETLLGPVVVKVDRGTATKSEVVSIPAPAGPYTLVVANGPSPVGSATISWNGVTVLRNGDLPSAGAVLKGLTPASGTNTLTATVSGAPSSSLSFTLEHELDAGACGASIIIDTPAQGEVVATRRLLVTGLASGSRDLGITVNGIPALYDLAAAGTVADPFRWSASLSPVAGPVEITARAVTHDGAVSGAARSITFAPAAETIGISGAPESGAVPLTVNFALSSSIAGAVTAWQLDLDGDGVYEQSSAAAPADLSATYAAGGARTVRARATTADGRVFTASAIVIPQTFAEADRVIRATWTRFTEALARGDVDNALEEVAGPERKAKYRPPLEVLGVSLPEYAAKITDIRPIWIHGNAAHYLMVKEEDGSTYGYHVYFVRDGDGVWRVLQF